MDGGRLYFRSALLIEASFFRSALLIEASFFRLALLNRASFETPVRELLTSQLVTRTAAGIAGSRIADPPPGGVGAEKSPAGKSPRDRREQRV